MKKFNLRTIFFIAFITGMTAICYAQSKLEASVGADLVSRYVWRGQELGGASIQPSLSVSYKGLSLSAWGSVDLSDTFNGNETTKELDLTLNYQTGGFNIGVTDYWFTGGAGYFQYAAHETKHTFEANIGYDFGFMAVKWFTNFAGITGNYEGDRAYASYISVAAPFQLGGLNWTAEIGATPWANDFYNNTANGFEVCSLSLSSEKELKISESFTLPLFAQIVWNPATDGAWFVAGVSF